MEARGRINCYICTTCKKGTYTINLRRAGTTPFVTQCQHCGFATAESGCIASIARPAWR